MNTPRLMRGTRRFLWLFLVAFVLGGCAHTSSSAGLMPTRPALRSSPPLAPPAPCQIRHFRLAFDKGGVGLSNEGAQFVFVNQSKENCTLSGYPALQLLDARHHPIRARIEQTTVGYLYITQAPHRFVLQMGGKAYFVVEWANLGCGKIPPASYASSVSFLRVTPPLSQASLLVAVQFCAFRNAVEISPLEPDKVLGAFA